MGGLKSKILPKAPNVAGPALAQTSPTAGRVYVGHCSWTSTRTVILFYLFGGDLSLVGPPEPIPTFLFFFVVCLVSLSPIPSYPSSRWGSSGSGASLWLGVRVVPIIKEFGVFPQFAVPFSVAVPYISCWSGAAGGHSLCGCV